MQRMSDTPGGLSLFGKLCSRGDFIRVTMADEAGVALESWLTDAVERSHGELPATPVRFLFAHGATTLLGTWVRSRDEVGRSFPLSAFIRVSAELAGLRWSLLPVLFDGFLAGLETTLSSQLDQPPEAVLKEVLSLPMPHPSELVRAVYDAQERLAREPSSVFGRRVFGPTVELPLAYALFTLREACARAPLQLTLDLPLSEAYDSFVWLELLSAVARQDSQQEPAWVWSAVAGRALASFEAPSRLVCAYLLNEEHASSARWPVASGKVDGQQALQQLPHDTQAALRSEAALSTLLAGLRGDA